MPNWGQSNNAAHTTTAATAAFRMMGGTFVSGSGLTLDSVSVYLDAPGPGRVIRVGVYQGGSLSNPVGATLVQDLGTASIVQAAPQWYTINATGTPSLTPSVPTWIAVKASTTVTIYFSGSSANAGDFQTARGRADIAGATNGIDHTLAFPSTLDGTASFANFWNPWYLTYSSSGGGPSSAVFRAYYAHTSG